MVVGYAPCLERIERIVPFGAILCTAKESNHRLVRAMPKGRRRPTPDRAGSGYESRAPGPFDHLLLLQFPEWPPMPCVLFAVLAWRAISLRYADGRTRFRCSHADADRKQDGSRLRPSVPASQPGSCGYRQ